jgi:hypothetical protein
MLAHTAVVIVDVANVDCLGLMMDFWPVLRGWRLR